jgi:calcineurin-like phosphoesterase family protein
MKNYWFTADHHFNHPNICKWTHRPFTSIEEHDATLIENWNRVVNPKDDVYFLGDFAWKNINLLSTRRKLHGSQIFFIKGNHDKAATTIKSTFAWWDNVKMTKVNNQEIWLSHYAHRVWPKSHHGAIHLYGHSHASLLDDPHAKSMDVGVDSVAMLLTFPEAWGKGIIPESGADPKSYRPINFDEIMPIMEKKIFVPVDHHGSLE